MMPLIADDFWMMKDLADFNDTVEIWDTNGRLIGVFVPANLERCKQRYAEAMARTDPEELARRAAEPGPRCLHKEVIEELKSLYPVSDESADLNQRDAK